MLKLEQVVGYDVLPGRREGGTHGMREPARVVSTGPASESVATSKPGACLAWWSRPQAGSRLRFDVSPLGQGTRWSSSQSVAGRSQPARKQVCQRATTSFQIVRVGR